MNTATSPPADDDDDEEDIRLLHNIHAVGAIHATRSISEQKQRSFQLHWLPYRRTAPGDIGMGIAYDASTITLADVRHIYTQHSLIALACLFCRHIDADDGGQFFWLVATHISSFNEYALLATHVRQSNMKTYATHLFLLLDFDVALGIRCATRMKSYHL